MMFTTALSADSCDYAFLRLNKSRHASSIIKLHFSDGCIKHYIAKSVHVATGKQETVKAAQVCNESMKT